MPLSRRTRGMPSYCRARGETNRNRCAKGTMQTVRRSNVGRHAAAVMHTSTAPMSDEQADHAQPPQRASDLDHRAREGGYHIWVYCSLGYWYHSRTCIGSVPYLCPSGPRNVCFKRDTLCVAYTRKKAFLGGGSFLVQASPVNTRYAGPTGATWPRTRLSPTSFACACKALLVQLEQCVSMQMPPMR